MDTAAYWATCPNFYHANQWEADVFLCLGQPLNAAGDALEIPGDALEIPGDALEMPAAEASDVALYAKGDRRGERLAEAQGHVRFPLVRVIKGTAELGQVAQ